ncbi:MAG TPA: GAF domain-containing protein [Thermoflexia bacterium]|nr:GAF domain-containing protein [Thermoflexia bacterium]
MSNWVKRFLAPPVFEDDEDQARNAALLNTLLWATFGIIVAAAPVLIIFNTSASGVFLSTVIVVLFALAVLGLIRVLHRGRVRLATILVLLLLLVMFTVTIYTFGGIRNTTASGYLIVVFIAGLLLGGRAALVFGLLSMLGALGVFCAERYWTIPIPFTPKVNFDDLGMLFAFSGLMVVLVNLAQRSIVSALERARSSERILADANRELRVERDAFQSRIREMERRSRQFQAAAEVARDIVAARELGDLLNRAVNLIRERFGFYHAGIFLVNDQGEYAVLQAATGKAGRQMLEQGHRLKVGEVGIVGYVTAVGLSRIALDVGADAVHFDNPLLPETRSEMALPLRVGKDVIGALDVQSRDAGAFDEEDVTILQTIADQVAVAIQNARLLHEAQQTVRELETVSGQYTQEAWLTERPRGYRYRGLGVEQVFEYPSEVRQAWQQGDASLPFDREGDASLPFDREGGASLPFDREGGASLPFDREGRLITTPQLEAGGDGGETISSLAVPLKLRDQVLGVLHLRFEDDAASPEMISLVEEMADRLALALESARLFEETQSRARREQTIRQITEQMRRAVDVETILQTTITRLGEAVGAPRVYVRLGTGVEKLSDNNKRS